MLCQLWCLHASLSLDIYSYNWVLLVWNYLVSLSLKKRVEMTKIRWIPFYYISMGAYLKWDSENLLWAGFLCYILFILRETKEEWSDVKMPQGNTGKDNGTFSLRDQFEKLVCIISAEHMLGEHYSDKSKPSPREQSDKMSQFRDIYKSFSFWISIQTI